VTFRNNEEAHQHSLQTLNTFYEFDDFMESLSLVADFGCGNGLDLEWWATRTTRDDAQRPLNIECVGIDTKDELPIARQYRNIIYQKTDFEEDFLLIKQRPYDLIWCHNSFQYCINPVQTLGNWWHKVSLGGILALVVPQTTNIHRKQQAFELDNGCYYHHTLVSLMYMLAVNGWDCRNGYFLKQIDDNWLHAVVYKSEHKPMNPKTTTWHNLAELGLLPESAEKSIYAHNAVRQQDLILPWMDKSLTWYGNH